MDFFNALWRDFNALFGQKVELGTNTVTTLNIIVWSLFIGFIVAIGATLYNKLIIGTIVRELVDRKIHTPESALTAKEVGCDNVFIRFALRSKGSLRRVVYVASDIEGGTARIDFSTARYYVPEDNIHRAEVVYGKLGTSVISILLAVLAFLIVALVAFLIIPDIIQMIGNVSNI